MLAVTVALALQHGVQLPAESPSWVTWDPALRQTQLAPLIHHDDHLHVRLSPRRVNRAVAG